MKKIRSLNFNKKLFFLGTALSISFVGTFLLNKYLENFYKTRKIGLENKIEKFLNKDVDLGDYSGIRFLGISLNNLKITDNENLNSQISANNIYIGIMPIRSFLNQRWIFNVKPTKTNIEINKDFFKRGEFDNNEKRVIKNKVKYDLYLNLKESANLKFYDIGIETKLKGKLIYKSKSKHFIGDFQTYKRGKGNLNLRLNTKLNKGFLNLEVLSRGFNLEGSEYSFGDRKFALRGGKIKSYFKFYKSPKKSFCEGNLSLNNLRLKTNNLVEDIKTDSIRFLCQGNNIIADTRNLNYGTLISDLNLNIPLNKNINNINLKGDVGYLDSLNPEIQLSGDIPYWFDKRGINFGNINSSFILNRTQLSNLNIFRKDKIRGFITAKGELKGEINKPDVQINFNVDYPHYKGIRIREIWDGEIKNQNNKYVVNMKNRYSPVPSFLTFNFDSKINLENMTFSRIFNSNKGSINLVKDNDKYTWNANNFPLDELELSISNNEFDRVSGIVNGSGFISKDQSYFDGRLAWSLGKYRNIKFANSLFDFNLDETSFYINSSLYPIDGGMIDLEYDSNKNNIFNINFNNISTSWTILTAVDILNFDNKQVLPNTNSRVLDDIEIDNIESSFKEKILFINNFVNNDNSLEDKFNLKKYLGKFESRYDANVSIEGKNLTDFRLKTNLNGYLDVKKDIKKSSKEKFSLDLEGGLFTGNGFLKINKLPLKTINIFLDNSRDFEGNLDINLLYDLDKKSFTSNISSNDTSINNTKILLDNGEVQYNGSNFDLDLSLLLNNSSTPLNVSGSIPINGKDKLDLRLNGNGKFIELIDILSDDYFTFKKGDVNLRMIIKGTINKPIANGFIFIKDSEIDIYSNIIKDINSTIIFDFDHIEIKSFKASDSDSGNIFIEGALPFYNNRNFYKEDISLKANKLNIKSNNIQFLVDSKINIGGSFIDPIFGGSLVLNNGFINLSNSKNNSIESDNRNINQENDKKNWRELFWNKDKNIEIISNETILNSFLLKENWSNYIKNISFNNLKVKLGPSFRIQYSEIVKANLDTKGDLIINGNVGNDLNARGFIDITKGRANLYTTPFKLNKNNENYILFASRSGIIPWINFSLISKVPDSIIPITNNNQDANVSSDLSGNNSSSGFGSFGIGNTRLTRIEASYEGFLDQLSFEDVNKKIQLRSTPSYSRSQIIGLIGGNSANLINRAFISQINGSNAFSERFQLSLYPALIENNESINNVFSNEKLELDDSQDSSSSDAFSSQAWVAEMGLDISDGIFNKVNYYRINFAMQATPDRDDLAPQGILTLDLTFEKIINLELLGSFDSEGDWKSQVQLFFRY
ncbi:translocation/assembly module TamB [Prochlorococcus sp. AH-716-F10]|nr:translocation/assembly module TamB [Prochlorococcus sp. AH-716-F10]